jgi:hypothetical protein
VVPGKHNSVRPVDVVDSLCVFWTRILQPPEVLIRTFSKKPTLAYWENTDEAILLKALQESEMESEDVLETTQTTSGPCPL